MVITEINLNKEHEFKTFDREDSVQNDQHIVSFEIDGIEHVGNFDIGVSYNIQKEEETNSLEYNIESVFILANEIYCEDELVELGEDIIEIETAIEKFIKEQNH